MPPLPTKNSLLGCGKELLLDGDPLSCAWVEDRPANVDTAARIESTVIYFTSPSVQRSQAAGLKWARLSSSNRTSGLERGGSPHFPPDHPEFGTTGCRTRSLIIDGGSGRRGEVVTPHPAPVFLPG